MARATGPLLVRSRSRARRGTNLSTVERESFGIFLDSSPDRWGKVLIERRAAVRARKAGHAQPALTSWDYLLGVHDLVRLGALRFRRDPLSPFLDDDKTFAVPPLASLRELEAISLKLESKHAEEDPNYERWLEKLVAPGSSLGGARPKAAVLDADGHLLVAKFPSRMDRHDVGAWETVVHHLAKRAGIDVVDARAEMFSELGHTFLSKRFDRTATGGRRAFVSAMTLLQRTDGEAGAGYLELVELIQSRGAKPKADLEQLFRRVVFNISVSNTDDHLRNHGFFIEEGGLVLSPAFDMNPNPDRSELTLAIDEVDASCDLDLALSVAEQFGLTAARAKQIVRGVQKAVSRWREEAKRLGLPKREIEHMARAFRS